MDQPKLKMCVIKLVNLSIEHINFYVNYFVLAYNRAKIAKQSEHCTKLE